MAKTPKTPTNPELTRRIQELIAFKGGGHNPAMVEDIIENALKLLTDVKDSGDVRVIQTALREMRYAFRLFAPYSQKRKVTIFGSVDSAPHAFVADENTTFRWRREPVTMADIHLGDTLRAEGAIEDGVFTATAVNVMGMPPGQTPTVPRPAPPR